MSDIKKELEDVYTSYLQDEWDEWIVNGWLKYKSVHMTKSVNYFCYRHNITDEQFYKLKRTPKFLRQQHCGLTRFIAAYLPLLNNMLWNETSKDEILKTMKVIDTLNAPIDARKSSKEQYEMTKAKKEAYAEAKSHKLVEQQRDQSSRSNWTACK